MCEHKWVRGSDLNGCGVCQGEYGPADGILAASSTETPQIGDVCWHCQQIYGQPEGVMHEGFTKFIIVQKKLSES